MDHLLNCALPYVLIGATLAFTVTHAAWQWKTIRAEYDREMPEMKAWRAQLRLEKQLKTKIPLR